jgi:hypothetical protein
VIIKLEDASVNAGRRQPPTVTVLKSVAKTYKKLLLSRNFSDITFVWADSPYFESALGGPRAENNSNGEWKTSHSSQIMKTILSLIY